MHSTIESAIFGLAKGVPFKKRYIEHIYSKIWCTMIVYKIDPKILYFTSAIMLGLEKSLVWIFFRNFNPSVNEKILKIKTVREKIICTIIFNCYFILWDQIWYIAIRELEKNNKIKYNNLHTCNYDLFYNFCKKR
jgi:hypothetical protein